jgi:hypothetical protein
MGLFPQKIAPAITLLAMYRHESVFLDARTSAQRARKYRDGKMWATRPLIYFTQTTLLL